jgi:hypothetical protein
VNYKRIDEVKDNEIEINEIPFIKRMPYKCEQEFRIIWEGNVKKEKFEIDFSLTAIKKITLNQNMPEEIFNSISKILKDNIINSEKIINRSSLFQNNEWIRKFKTL